MNKAEWESLCDGCAKCCLIKLEDEDSGEVAYTSLACSLLDIASCRCRCYEKRHELVPECVWLTLKDIDKFHWLPKTCAYRLLSEGKELPNWHPLVSGSKETVFVAGIAVRSFAIIEEGEDPEDFIIEGIY